jgi:hypothetical protein
MAPSRREAILLVAAVALAILPILLTSHLPLLDVAGHESRVVVLRDILLTGTGSPFYRFDTMWLPNIGFDLPGMVMAVWMSPDRVGRWFFTATLVLTLVGVAVLGRVATGRWSPVRLAAALLLHNLFTLLGFLSYGMGVALMLWALAGRLLLKDAATLVRLLVGSLFGIVLLFCHLSAFAIYAVMLAGLGLDLLSRRRDAWPRVALMAAELLPALCIFALMRTGREGRLHYELPYWHAKILGAIKSVSGGSMTGDVAFMVGALAVVAFVATTGTARLNRALVPGLVALTLLYFVVPSHAGGGSYVDARIPVVVVLLALAALDVDVRRPRLALALAVIAGGAYITKQAALTVLWRSEDRVLSGIADVLGALPEGAVILQAECVPDADDILAVYRSRQPPLTHVAALASFADGRFAASTWAQPGQQPVRVQPAYRPYKEFQDRIAPSVCDAQDYGAILTQARAVAAEQTAAGVVVPPLYLLLLRPPTPDSLRPVTPLVATMADLELYAVAAADR